MSLTVGLKGRAETTVTPETTAAAVGSGSLPVLATPVMAALMEKAAANAAAPCLAPGEGTVGVELHITHDSATPVGMRVWAEAELTAADGRSLTFRVNAFDEAGPIGQGTHRRYVIQNDRFLSKAQGKKGI